MRGVVPGAETVRPVGAVGACVSVGSEAMTAVAGVDASLRFGTAS